MEAGRMDEESQAAKRGRRNRQRGMEHERIIERTLEDRGYEPRKTREYTTRSARAWDVEFTVDQKFYTIQCKRRRPKGPIAAIARDFKEGRVSWYSIWNDGLPIVAVLEWNELLRYFGAWVELNRLKCKGGIDYDRSSDPGGRTPDWVRSGDAQDESRPQLQDC